MDERTKRVAIAICDRERGPVGDNQCKTCRDAHYRYNPAINDDEVVEGIPWEGCLGLGYEYLAEVALEAADKG